MSETTLNDFLASVERRAFVMARMAVGNHDDALDIVQDAMFKLVQKYSDRAPSEWGPLFHRIMQSRITDWYRHQAVRGRVMTWLGGGNTEEAETDPIAETPDLKRKTPEQALDLEQEMVQLQCRLASLPLRQRQAFLLRCWEGMDIRETAVAMRCSQGSVKTHYHRALKALQAHGERGEK